MYSFILGEFIIPIVIWKIFALLSSFIKSIIIILMSIFIFTKILHFRKIGKYIKTQRRKLKHPKLPVHS